jgi:hypothetical protein
VFVLWLTVLAAGIVFSFDQPLWLVGLVGMFAVTIGSGAIMVDRRSQRVIGPDRIAFISPMPGASWSVA